MKAKSKRNSDILALFKGGKTVADIARKYKLSWPRTKRIIDEEQERQLPA